MGGTEDNKKEQKTLLSHTIFAILAIRSWKDFIFLKSTCMGGRGAEGE